jgi:AcrR family transcriptional regulator
MTVRSAVKAHRDPPLSARPGLEGGKRDLNRKKRVADLLEASLPLFLERGIEGVTIDDIVLAAGMAKGSYYRYFEDKTELVRALLAPLSAKVDESFAACAAALAEARSPEGLAGAYLTLAGALGEVFVSSPGAVRLYLQESRAPAVAARVAVAELARRVERGAIDLTHVAHAHGLLRPMDARVSSGAVVGAVERLLFGVLTGDDLGDPEAVVRELITLVLDGLRPRP